MIDLCCIGHLTLDKVVTPRMVKYMPGGTSFYFSNAVTQMDITFSLVTTVGEKEHYIVDDLREKGLSVTTVPTRHTLYFENIYNENQDHRTQRVSQEADPFTVSSMAGIQAKIFHLGPLLARDIPLEVVQYLSTLGLVSLDVQGYLRVVKDQSVLYTDWVDKKEGLAYIDILKANEFEMEALTGTRNIETGVKILADYGVREIVITLGSMGSILYKDQTFYRIPAYTPNQVTDATGCGDTYMAAYLYKKIKGAGLEEAGHFAAAMSTLKIQASGPFTGNIQDVEALLQQPQGLVYPEIILNN